MITEKKQPRIREDRAYIQLSDGRFRKLEFIRSKSNNLCLDYWMFSHCLNSSNLREIADYLDKKNGVTKKKKTHKKTQAKS